MTNIFVEGKRVFANKAWYKSTSVPHDLPPDAICMQLALSTGELQDQFQAGSVFYNDLLAEAIEELFPERMSLAAVRSLKSVFDFNDHPHTTREDINAVYDLAASLLTVHLLATNKTEGGDSERT